MSGKWIVIDVSYMCWRLFYAKDSGLRNLSHGDMKTGILFGFLRDLLLLQSELVTTNVAFCFDSKTSHREAILPSYKSSRKKKRQEMDDEDVKAIEEMYAQIAELRQFFSKVGFVNVFHENGYEADDMIASVVINNPDYDIAIVSADKDLYQLLRPGVFIHQPGGKPAVTHKTFKRDWRIKPKTWVSVKALAGCNTDDVPGCPGVGEKTAIKFLKKELKDTSTTYENIQAFMPQAKKNIRLVKLPYPGCPVCVLQDDDVSHKRWNKILSKYGIRSLRHNPPRLKR